MKALCRIAVLEVAIPYLIKGCPPVAYDVMKRLPYLNEVGKQYMVGCCERKMAPTIVNNRICFARFLRCRREVDVSFVVRVTFLGTRIVLPVHLVHWVRWGFATAAKPVLYELFAFIGFWYKMFK
jgi:hypothetical protein